MPLEHIECGFVGNSTNQSSEENLIIDIRKEQDEEKVQTQIPSRLCTKHNLNC